MAINFSYISDEITEVLTRSNELAIESPEVRCRAPQSAEVSKLRLQPRRGGRVRQSFTIPAHTLTKLTRHKALAVWVVNTGADPWGVVVGGH